MSAPIVHAKQVGVALFWALAFIAARVLAELGSPLTVSAIRYLIAALLFVVLLGAARTLTLPPQKQRLKLALMGFSGIALYSYLFFAGLETVPVGRGALIIAINPVAVALVGALLGMERMSPLRAVGIIISLAGTLTVLTHGDFVSALAQGVGRGELMLLGCTAGWAAYTLIGRSVFPAIGATQGTAHAIFIGTTFLLIATLARGSTISATALHWKHAAAFFVTGVLGTVVAFKWYADGIASLGAAAAGAYINLVPVFAALFGIVLLGERLDAATVVGGALVLVGVVLTQRATVV